MDIEPADAVLVTLKAEGLIPFAIMGTVSTTDHGVIHSLDDAATLAKKHGLWVQLMVVRQY
ncbi:hypothetical protein BTN50_0373 [Candidatus Enterovibrio altilux]|uniref:Uncharacterized protein n=1 Tax=Candidatus Enterovibrio altilux TaxID=1927128 RepID=A0A291B7E2_9GAMM|nr:hypothetical protein BTN50_0373 [Candidatus Enterovibrio luxaltus]